jgi:ribosomal protein S18 acetylase RimI-like enzyme
MTHFKRLSSTKKADEYGLFLNDKRIGMAMFCPTWLDNTFYIGNICILNAYRGKGYGSILMQHVIGQAERSGASKIILRVSKKNPIAISLYKKFNFEVVEENEVGFRMEREI